MSWKIVDGYNITLPSNNDSNTWTLPGGVYIGWADLNNNIVLLSEVPDDEKIAYILSDPIVPDTELDLWNTKDEDTTSTNYGYIIGHSYNPNENTYDKTYKCYLYKEWDLNSRSDKTSIIITIKGTSLPDNSDNLYNAKCWGEAYKDNRYYFFAFDGDAPQNTWFDKIQDDTGYDVLVPPGFMNNLSYVVQVFGFPDYSLGVSPMTFLQNYTYETTGTNNITADSFITKCFKYGNSGMYTAYLTGEIGNKYFMLNGQPIFFVYANDIHSGNFSQGFKFHRCTLKVAKNNNTTLYKIQY